MKFGVAASGGTGRPEGVFGRVMAAGGRLLAGRGRLSGESWRPAGDSRRPRRRLSPCFSTAIGFGTLRNGRKWPRTRLPRRPGVAGGGLQKRRGRDRQRQIDDEKDRADSSIMQYFRVGRQAPGDQRPVIRRPWAGGCRGIEVGRFVMGLLRPLGHRDCRNRNRNRSPIERRASRLGKDALEKMRS